MFVVVPFHIHLKCRIQQRNEQVNCPAHFVGVFKLTADFLSVPDQEVQSSGFSAGGEYSRGFDCGFADFGLVQPETVLVFSQQILGMTFFQALALRFRTASGKQPVGQWNQGTKRTQQRRRRLQDGL